MSKKDNFITVSTFNTIIKELLTENLCEVVKIKGEVSNLKISNSNTFFTLKDTSSAISVISWNNTFNIANGDDVFVTGKLACYPKQGTYNIHATKAERIGIGNLFETYEKSKKTFETQGYFSKKRQFPTTINKIGIVSAYSGAALQDILCVLKANLFNGNVYVKNCYAQGKYCANSIKCGIEYFNNCENNEKVDIILISRGGGSIEDLMGYSTEIVVKAISMSDIFTISAVGHEIDTMLSDYAADHRSPTPTRAAEEITCANNEITKEFENCRNIVSNLKLMVENIIYKYTKELHNKLQLLSALNPVKLIENEINNLKNIKHGIYNKIKQRIDTFQYRLEAYKLKNQSFDAINTFNKGFVMIVDKNNHVIKSANEFKLQNGLKIIFADGEVFI